MRISTLHKSGLEQLRIIGSGVPFRLSLADDGQHLHLLHGLRPKRKPSQVAVIQGGTVMPSQHVARSIKDDLTFIDFNALWMRRVMSEYDAAPASIRPWANARFSELTSAEREVAQ